VEENNTLVNPSTVSAHDDFDWSIDKRNVARYNNEEQLKYDAVYEGTFKQITDGEMVQGIVVGLTKTDVVINIGFKSDGLISLNEFRDLHGLKTGDVVEVMVVEKEDRKDICILAVSKPVFHALGNALLRCTNLAKWLPVWLPAKPKVVLSLTSWVWKHSSQDLRST
jgi:hypothetical protein